MSVVVWGDPASERRGTDADGALEFSALTLPLAGGEEGGRVSGPDVDALGVRGAVPALPEDAVVARFLSAWFDAERFVSVRAVRAAGAEGHDREEVDAFFVTPDEPEPVRVDEARISTTYDGGGNPLRVGVELWLTPDAPYPQRLAGTRLGDGFFAWTLEGHRGIGRYDVLRRA